MSVTGPTSMFEGEKAKALCVILKTKPPRLGKKAREWGLPPVAQIETPESGGRKNNNQSGIREKIQSKKRVRY
jgi:hypothetical protein